MEKIIVLIIAISLIVFIIWWFFGKHKISQNEANVDGNKQTATIIINGGYNPAILELKKGIPAELDFDRQDASPCLDEVLMPDFGVHQKVKMNEITKIEIPALEPGEYDYSCGMNMMHGKIIVK